MEATRKMAPKTKPYEIILSWDDWERGMSRAASAGRGSDERVERAPGVDPLRGGCDTRAELAPLRAHGAWAHVTVKGRDNDSTIPPCILSETGDDYAAQLSGLSDCNVWDCAMDAAETISFDLWEVAHGAESFGELRVSVAAAVRDAQSAIDALNDLLAELPCGQRHFVALSQGFICQDCLVKHPEVDVSRAETEVWQEGSEGWLEPVACSDCQRQIPVFDQNGKPFAL